MSANHSFKDGFMFVNAKVFAHKEEGGVAKVIKALRNIEGVTDATELLGVYDIVLRVHSEYETLRSIEYKIRDTGLVSSVCPLYSWDKGYVAGAKGTKKR